MQDSAYAVYLIFGILWILMGAAALIALFRSEGEEIRVGKWGLIVAIPILIPVIFALLIGAFRLRSGS
jgi:uncharacterized membrane protein HdeD (DUF308 family)